MKPSPRVLVVDDDPEIGDMLARALSRRGFVIETSRSAEEALQRTAGARYDAALVDLVMPGQDGRTLAGELRGRFPGIPIALLTGYAHSPLLEAVERSGVAVFIKPVVIHEVADFLQRELER
jgi:two-component system response regulator RegA